MQAPDVQHPPTVGDEVERPAVARLLRHESGLPSTWQWNGSIQIVLPRATALDVEYIATNDQAPRTMQAQIRFSF